jgi:signal transduction histidine kinase
VAHDFNNLLMAVLGNLGLPRKRLAGGVAEGDGRALRLLDNAVQGAERGAALTRRLLAFARRQELRPEPVDLAALVGGIEEMLRRSLGPAVRLEAAVPPGLPPARVDANQLELALLNLAVNARDAMPEGGGALRVSAAAAAEAVAAPGAEPGGPPPGRYLRLEVSDTGLGMDAATLARAAEPFFTTKGAGKGTGLGLSMVHGLAAQSGGALRLRSAPGRGTTAELWLPEAAGAAAPAPPAAAPDGGPAASAPERRPWPRCAPASLWRRW